MAITRQDWLDAQYSVLGSVLISPELVPKVMTETTEADFTGPGLSVYRAIRKLFVSGVSVDVVSISNALGPDYRELLVQLMEITPTAANIDSYIQLCREQARVIAAQDIGRQMAQTESSAKIRQLLEQASGLMIDRPSIHVTTMEEALRSFMNRHTATPQYLTWPLPDFNKEIYAEPGDFIIFGGRPSTGKSAWALQCAWHWAKTLKVGFFSLETSAEKLFDRQMAAVAQIEMDDIKRNAIRDATWQRIASMNQDIISANLELVRAAGMSPADIRAMTLMRGYQLIIIDYLQLLQSAGENRTAQVTNISIALHTMAQSLGVTVVALSQLARQGQQGGNQGMAALRESGQIEQDADVVMILSLEDQGKPSGNRVMSIEKNKEGTCPNILLAFDGKYQTFSKAQRTGETVSKLKAMARAEQRRQREETRVKAQLSMLPDHTPVPFEKG